MSKRYRNKYITISKVEAHISRNSHVVNDGYYLVHDPDMNYWMLSQKGHRLVRRYVKLGLNRNIKPRVEN